MRSPSSASTAFDEIDEREVVGVEVLAQPRVERDRVGVDAEDLGELLAHDPLDLVAVERAAVAVRLGRHASAPRPTSSRAAVGEALDDVRRRRSRARRAPR